MIPRRLTFQLTPLLDLLLIVIFAQYMEVQQNAESAQRELLEQKEDLEQRFAGDQQELAEKRQRFSDHYESILKQHQQAGTALAEALNLSGFLMDEILKLRTDGAPGDASSLESAVGRMQALLESRDAEMLQFILRYDEMQKHVSVWELYLQDNGQAIFSDGGQTLPVSFETEEEFVSRAFEASKAFTEPKPLVIILLSYGSPYAIQRQRATDSMPILVNQMRQDSGGTRWFDFSLMGYRASGPLFIEGEVRNSEKTLGLQEAVERAE